MTAPSTCNPSNIGPTESFDITALGYDGEEHEAHQPSQSQPPHKIGLQRDTRRASLLASTAAAVSGGGANNSLEDSIKFHARDFLTHKQQDLLADYELGQALGEGGFGLVYSCIHNDSGADRAVKIIQKDPMREEYNQNIIKEYNILKELDHPNLLKVYDLYQDEEAYFIVTDLYEGGDFFDVLEEQGPLIEEDAAVVLNNLLNCVNYCHERNLVHRDLKPENILMSDKKRDFSDIKVIDFGLARYVQHIDEKLTGLAGSAYYVAPQVIEGEYTAKCDVWSCGVIAYALISGFAPFDASTDAQVLKVVYAGDYDFEDEEWDDVSDLAKDFIRQLLSYDEVDRPTAKEALQHPWLRKCRTSPRMNNALVRSASRSSLRSLTNFTSKSNKLKQAACAMISSQLLRKEEKEVIDRAFRAMDKSCNGTISKDDLNSSMTDLFREDEPDSGSDSDDDDASNISENSRANLIDEIFEEVNFSGTGAIQYSEFAIVHMLEKNMVDDVKLRAAFKFFDLGGKGYISMDDLKTVMKLGNHSAKKIMKETAGPESDRITFENFSKCILPDRSKKGDTAAGKDVRRGLVVTVDTAQNKSPEPRVSKKTISGRRQSSLTRSTNSDNAPSIGRIISFTRDEVEKIKESEDSAQTQPVAKC